MTEQIKPWLPTYEIDYPRYLVQLHNTNQLIAWFIEWQNMYHGVNPEEYEQ